MSTYVNKIRLDSSHDWLELPVAIELTVTPNALDGANTGRNASTGDMFRDLVTLKLNFSATFPETSNTLGALIQDIILASQFEAYIPNTRTGAWAVKTFYCTSCPMSVKRAFPDGTWINGEFSTEWVEM